MLRPKQQLLKEKGVEIPAQFDACVKSGGRVRTKSLKEGKFIRICFKDGKSFAGEVQIKGSMEKRANE